MKALRGIGALIILAAAGCVQIDQKLAINPDGSGTLRIQYQVPDETTQRLRAMLKLAEELAQAGGEALLPAPSDDFLQLLMDPRESDIRKKMAAYEPLGIRIDELTVNARSGRKEVDLRVSFRDLEDLARADFFAEYGFNLVRTSPDAYTWQTRPATREPFNPEWSAEDQETYKLVAPLLGGFRYVLEVQTPGTILRTNADRHSAYLATWTFDFNADRDAVAKLQRRMMSIVWNAEGLTLPDIRQPLPAPVAGP